MLNTVLDLLYRISFLFFLGLAAYDVFRSLRASWLSGFKFYLGSILLQDLPLAFIALIIITAEEIDTMLGLLVIVLLPINDSWIIKQQKKAQQTHPAQWKAWEEKISQARGIDKALLYRRIHRQPQPTSLQETAQAESASLKTFSLLDTF